MSIKLWVCLRLNKSLEKNNKRIKEVELELQRQLKLLSKEEFYEFGRRTGYLSDQDFLDEMCEE